MSDSDNMNEEEFVLEDEADLGPGALKRLREKLAKAVAEKQEYLDGWQRSRADFANFKKEEATLHHDREERIRAELIEELLPVLDTFEMALAHKPSDEMQLLYKQFTESLGRVGVTMFGKVGETFDPHRFEALREVPTNDAGKDNTVESVARSGYAIAERVVRPAQVSVYAHHS